VTASRTRKPEPPAAIAGARVLVDDHGGSTADSSSKATAVLVPAPSASPKRRKRRARFVF
jgi:hypothetical protein